MCDYRTPWVPKQQPAHALDRSRFHCWSFLMAFRWRADASSRPAGGQLLGGQGGTELTIFFTPTTAPPAGSSSQQQLQEAVGRSPRFSNFRAQVVPSDQNLPPSTSRYMHNPRLSENDVIKPATNKPQRRCCCGDLAKPRLGRFKFKVRQMVASESALASCAKLSSSSFHLSRGFESVSNLEKP